MAALGRFTVSIIINYNDLNGIERNKKITLLRMDGMTEEDAKHEMNVWRDKNPGRGTEHYGEWNQYVVFL